MSGKYFLDTNIIIYLLSDDVAKADVSENLVSAGGVVSVQVLNEFASVGVRKLKLSLAEIGVVLDALRLNCEVVGLTLETHDLGMNLMSRYAFSLYDAMIVAAAILSESDVLYSEDMQDGLIVNDRLTIVNPYK